MWNASSHTTYTLCTSDMLSLSKPRRTTNGLHTFQYFSTKQWSALPDELIFTPHLFLFLFFFTSCDCCGLGCQEVKCPIFVMAVTSTSILKKKTYAWRR